jgi:hypothetical protein
MLYKNIKFPKKVLFYILDYIIKTLKHPEIAPKKHSNFKELRFKLITDNFLLIDSRCKTTIKKKLNHFISVLICIKNSTFKKYNLKVNENESELFETLIKSFIKKTPSCYLRLEDAEELIEKYKSH